MCLSLAFHSPLQGDIFKVSYGVFELSVTRLRYHHVTFIFNSNRKKLPSHNENQKRKLICVRHKCVYISPRTLRIDIKYYLFWHDWIGNRYILSSLVMLFLIHNYKGVEMTIQYGDCLHTTLVIGLNGGCTSIEPI